jgi:hypothetical protein
VPPTVVLPHALRNASNCEQKQLARKAKKKAAWFPKRPFLSYGSLTF